MSLYENVQAARRKPETERVGLRYSAEDDADILRQAADGVPVTRIALTHKRTVRAMRERLAMLVVKLMIREGITLKEASRRYHINIVRLSRTYQHERDRIRQATRVIRDACE
jgi:hypothetical protein